MDANPLRIDVVSDVVCPWCFVGKRQLEQALARWRRDHPDLPVEVHWHPFQLNPDLPAEGMALIGAAAEQEGLQDAVVEALFVAYFQQARDLTDASALRQIAQAAGLAASAVDQALDNANAHQTVAEADQRARRAGIRGVPCFIVNGRSAVSGAQGADAIVEAMLMEAEGN